MSVAAAAAVNHDAVGVAFYKRGSTFPVKCFLSKGVPEPKKSQNANLVSKKGVFFLT